MIDLGDLAVLPRLVNAHTHLEFSDCETVIGSPGNSLAEWTRQVISARGSSNTHERDRAIAMGVAESVSSGVGLIGDIATTPSSYPARSDVRIVSFAEVLGLSPERADERFQMAAAHAEQCQLHPSNQFGVSPHAPYSTPDQLVARCIDLAKQNQSTLAMHVAESPDERQLLQYGTGPFEESLRGAGLWRDGLFPSKSLAPLVDLIDRLADAPRALLIHGNDLREPEIDAIARHRNLSVVYCPRTHHFFGYETHPVAKLLAAGIRVALGTDSKASNPDLSIWNEVRFLLRHRQDISPQQILRMALIDGASALVGESSLAGQICDNSPGIEAWISVETRAGSQDRLWSDFAEREIVRTESIQRA